VHNGSIISANVINRSLICTTLLHYILAVTHHTYLMPASAFLQKDFECGTAPTVVLPERQSRACKIFSNHGLWTVNDREAFQISLVHHGLLFFTDVSMEFLQDVNVSGSQEKLVTSTSNWMTGYTNRLPPSY